MSGARATKTAWCGLLLSLVGVLAAHVISLEPARAIMWLMAVIAPVSCVGFLMSISMIGRRPLLAVPGAILGVLGSIAASDIWFAILRP